MHGRPETLGHVTVFILLVSDDFPPNYATGIPCRRRLNRRVRSVWARNPDVHGARAGQKAQKKSVIRRHDGATVVSREGGARWRDGHGVHRVRSRQQQGARGNVSTAGVVHVAAAPSTLPAEGRPGPHGLL